MLIPAEEPLEQMWGTPGKGKGIQDIVSPTSRVIGEGARESLQAKKGRLFVGKWEWTGVHLSVSNGIQEGHQLHPL